MKRFWISWEEGVIAVGQGFYPQFRLVEWDDPDPERVNAISLNSGLHGADPPAQWAFSKVSGNAGLSPMSN